jgi:DNA-binding NarL/FixJ family response regulator
MAAVNILVADDHEVARKGVRALLEAQPGWAVCAEARTGREAVAKSIEMRPDVVVLDIGMPELNGLDAARQILRSVRTKILILTVHASDAVAREALEAGAGGYVLKIDAGRKLVDAVRALIADHVFVTDRVHDILQRTATSESRLLTLREREVLQLLAEGRTNKEIGAALGIAIKTAETHRAHIMTKLGLHSMSELVRYAVRNQIIEP